MLSRFAEGESLFGSSANAVVYWFTTVTANLDGGVDMDSVRSLPALQSSAENKRWLQVSCDVRVPLGPPLEIFRLREKVVTFVGVCCFGFFWTF